MFGAIAVIGLSHDEIRQHRAQVHKPYEIARCPDLQAEMRTQVGEQLSKREKVVTLKKGRHAQEDEQSTLVRRERLRGCWIAGRGGGGQLVSTLPHGTRGVAKKRGSVVRAAMLGPAPWPQRA